MHGVDLISTEARGSDVGAIDRLVAELSKLPGVGEKTARRFAFHILNSSRTFATDLAKAIVDVREKVKLCSRCCNLTESDPCRLCNSPRRDERMICVVERPTDVDAIERTGEFNGHFHVLHGVINPLDGIGPDDLKLAGLLERVRPSTAELMSEAAHPLAQFEVIVATNPSVNGEATASYIHRLLAPLGVVVSRIALGVPMGSDIEFADKVTLGRALAGRRPI